MSKFDKQSYRRNIKHPLKFYLNHLSRKRPNRLTTLNSKINNPPLSTTNSPIDTTRLTFNNHHRITTDSRNATPSAHIPLNTPRAPLLRKPDSRLAARSQLPATFGPPRDLTGCPSAERNRRGAGHTLRPAGETDGLRGERPRAMHARGARNEPPPSGAGPPEEDEAAAVPSRFVSVARARCARRWALDNFLARDPSTGCRCMKEGEHRIQGKHWGCFS